MPINKSLFFYLAESPSKEFLKRYNGITPCLGPNLLGRKWERNVTTIFWNKTTVLRSTECWKKRFFITLYFIWGCRCYKREINCSFNPVASFVHDCAMVLWHNFNGRLDHFQQGEPNHILQICGKYIKGHYLYLLQSHVAFINIGHGLFHTRPTNTLKYHLSKSRWSSKDRKKNCRSSGPSLRVSILVNCSWTLRHIYCVNITAMDKGNPPVKLAACCTFHFV